MVSHPSEYPWSSYRCNGIGHLDPLVTAHSSYIELRATEPDRQENYRSLFNTHITEIQLDEIRQASNKEWGLGSDKFKAKVEQQLQRRTTLFPRGGD